MQSQRNDTEDDDDVKLPLAYIKKVQNTTEVKTLASNETVPSTKSVVGRKRVDVSDEKVICIMGQYQTDGHPCEKVHN